VPFAGFCVREGRDLEPHPDHMWCRLLADGIRTSCSPGGYVSGLPICSFPIAQLCWLTTGRTAGWPNQRVKWTSPRPGFPHSAGLGARALCQLCSTLGGWWFPWTAVASILAKAVTGWEAFARARVIRAAKAMRS
jgi:hypothetical protein